MKEVVKYICGECGREFTSKKECLKCEERHNIPKEIVDWEAGIISPDIYNRTINPETVNIRMQNGDVETYIRSDIYYREVYHGK